MPATVDRTGYRPTVTITSREPGCWTIPADIAADVYDCGGWTGGRDGHAIPAEIRIEVLADYDTPGKWSGQADVAEPDGEPFDGAYDFITPEFDTRSEVLAWYADRHGLFLVDGVGSGG